MDAARNAGAPVRPAQTECVGAKVPMFRGDGPRYRVSRAMLTDEGPGCAVVCIVQDAATNPLSDDDARCRAVVDHLKRPIHRHVHDTGTEAFVRAVRAMREACHPPH